jgi:hypothetical protein
MDDKNYNINHFDPSKRIYNTPKFLKERHIVAKSIVPKDTLVPNSGLIMPRNGSTTNYIADVIIKLSDGSTLKGIGTICKSPITNKHFLGLNVWNVDKDVDYETFIKQFIADTKLQDPDVSLLDNSIFTEEDFMFGIGLNERNTDAELLNKKTQIFKNNYVKEYKADYE